MFTDPISDMLTRIRNSQASGRPELVMPYSKLKKSLADLLLKEGFIAGVNVLEGKHAQLQINLKYSEGAPVITGLKRISKPGQRMYAAVDRIPRTNGGYGVTVISTSKGLMSDKEARKGRMGGELICQIW